MVNSIVFFTQSRFIGLGPPACDEDDVVVVPFGVLMPYILRERRITINPSAKRMYMAL